MSDHTAPDSFEDVFAKAARMGRATAGVRGVDSAELGPLDLSLAAVASHARKESQVAALSTAQPQPRPQASVEAGQPDPLETVQEADAVTAGQPGAGKFAAGLSPQPAEIAALHDKRSASAERASSWIANHGRQEAVEPPSNGGAIAPDSVALAASASAAELTLPVGVQPPGENLPGAAVTSPVDLAAAPAGVPLQEVAVRGPAFSAVVFDVVRTARLQMMLWAAAWRRAGSAFLATCAARMRLTMVRSMSWIRSVMLRKLAAAGAATIEAVRHAAVKVIAGLRAASISFRTRLVPMAAGASEAGLAVLGHAARRMQHVVAAMSHRAGAAVPRRLGAAVGVVAFGTVVMAAVLHRQPTTSVEVARVSAPTTGVRNAVPQQASTVSGQNVATSAASSAASTPVVTPSDVVEHSDVAEVQPTVAAASSLLSLVTEPADAGNVALAEQLFGVVSADARPARTEVSASGWAESLAALTARPRIAVVRYDALQAARRAPASARIPALEVVAPLTLEPLYFLARADSGLQFVHDIEGKSINAGAVRSSRSLTVSTLYRALFGAALPAHSAQSQDDVTALDSLAAGKVDVVVLVGSAATPWFANAVAAHVGQFKLLAFDPKYPMAQKALTSFLPVQIAARGLGEIPAARTPTLGMMAFAVTSQRRGSDNVPDRDAAITQLAAELCGQQHAGNVAMPPVAQRVDPMLQLDVGWPYSVVAQEVFANCRKPGVAQMRVASRTPGAS